MGPYWEDAATTDDDGSQMRQSDRSSREATSDIYEEAEKTARNTDDEDDELQLNLTGGDSPQTAKSRKMSDAVTTVDFKSWIMSSRKPRP